MVNCILITVRTSSTRLPKKAILDINGKPAIQYLIENIKKSKSADKIILCTSEESDDDILCQIATDCGICLLYTSPSPRDVEESRMPSSA